MGFFYSVRGWLELNDELVMQVQTIVTVNKDKSPYVGAWHFPHYGGFSHFAFFGCTMRDVSLNEVKQQIQRIATTVISQDGEDVDYAEGIFHITPEDNACKTVWLGRNGLFIEQITKIE